MSPNVRSGEWAASGNSVTHSLDAEPRVFRVCRLLQWRLYLGSETLDIFTYAPKTARLSSKKFDLTPSIKLVEVAEAFRDAPVAACPDWRRDPKIRTHRVPKAKTVTGVPTVTHPLRVKMARGDGNQQGQTAGISTSNAIWSTNCLESARTMSPVRCRDLKQCCHWLRCA